MWTTLYALIGLACAETFGLSPLAQPRALLVFGVHAVLNLAWAPVFFGAKVPSPVRSPPDSVRMWYLSLLFSY